MIDLSLVSDEEINREYWRRVNARRNRTVFTGGRAKVLRPCPTCGEMFGARELRAHQKDCASTRIKNPTHRWLVERGWGKAGVNRMGNRVQLLWAHPRHDGRTYTTTEAEHAEIHDQRQEKTA